MNSTNTVYDLISKLKKQKDTHDGYTCILNISDNLILYTNKHIEQPYGLYAHKDDNEYDNSNYDIKIDHQTKTIYVSSDIEKNQYSLESFHIILRLPELKELTIQGAGGIQFAFQENIKINHYGTGKLSLSGKNQDLILNSYGCGEILCNIDNIATTLNSYDDSSITLEGKSDQLIINSQSFSTINAKNLDPNYLIINSANSSKIEAFCNYSFSCQSQNNNITLYGNPQFTFLKYANTSIFMPDLENNKNCETHDEKNNNFDFKIKKHL